MSEVKVTSALAQLLSYVGALLKQDSCDEAQLPLGIPKRSWTAKGEGQYVGAWSASRRFAACVERRLDEIRTRPEFREALAAIESDTRLARFEGRDLGTPLSSRSFVGRDFLVHVCVNSSELHGRQLAPEAEIVARRISDALYSNSVPYELVAPLPRFSCPTLPLALGDGLRIDRLSERELQFAIEQRLVDVQMQPPPTMQFGNDGNRILTDDARYEWAYVPQSAAIHVRFDLPLTVGPYTTVQTDDALTTRSEADAKLTSLVSALRAFKEGYVWFPGAVLQSSSWWLEGSTSIAWSERVARGAFELTASEAAEFVKFWAQLRRPNCISARWFSAAIRRFGFSLDRSRLEDKLVDSMIAFESLFLHDAFDELSYRLAVRLSSYLDEPGEKRRSTFARLRDAYSARSAVVHGSTPKLGAFASLDEMVEFLSGTFRWTVRRLAREIANGAQSGSDWDAFVLEKTRDSE